MMFDSAAAIASLKADLARFTRRQLADLEARTGLRYLGNAGPVYLAGCARVRGAFVDVAGNHWADARLVAESAYNRTSAYEHYSYTVVAGQLADAAEDVWIAELYRGLHDAILAPIPLVAAVLDLPAPEPFPDGWARSWETLATVTDEAELALVATGWGAQPTT